MSSTILDSNNRSQPTTSKGTIPAGLQLISSDQLYRQSKIDQENHRLKNKSKADSGSAKKGKKSSKKTDSAAADNADESLYPTIKVTRGGELPEGATESGNEDNDEEKYVGRNKKYDPHRALNIDLNEPARVIPPSAPAPVVVPEPIPKVTEQSTTSTTKTKTKKKKTTDKDEKPKSKSKRERTDYKQLSPGDEEDKQVASPTPPVASSTIVETTVPKEKVKKKKPKVKESTTETITSSSFVPDIMGDDDINPMSSSNQQGNEPAIYKSIAESEHLLIVSLHFIFTSKENNRTLFIYRNLPVLHHHLPLN